MKTLIILFYLLTTDYSDWVAVSEPPDLRDCYKVYKCETEGLTSWYIYKDDKVKTTIGYYRPNNSSIILWDKKYLNCK